MTAGKTSANLLKTPGYLLVIILSVTVFSIASKADNWSCFRGDNQRSGISQEHLQFPMSPSWVYKPILKPAPAWPEMPAKQDYWHNIAKLSPSNTYDRVFHVTAAEGMIFFSSSADDSIYCLDRKNGKEKWCFTTQGPVRISPTYYNGKIYAGSDDGYVYCLDSKNAKLIWKYRPAEDERLPGNGRIISMFPIRCGIIAEEGKIYFTAGLFPNQGVYLCCVDAENGQQVYKKQIDCCSQGYMLASPTRLFVPTGRTSPYVFDKSNGNKLLGEQNDGGCFAILLDDMLAYGPDESGQITIADPEKGEKIVTSSGRRILAENNNIYIQKNNTLCRLDRDRYLQLSREIAKTEKIKEKERTELQEARLLELKTERNKCLKWQVECKGYFSLIMAGKVILAGGENKVFAYDSDTGENIWTANIAGKAYGLAVSDSKLYISTDKGNIYCFTKKASKNLTLIAQQKNAPYPKDKKTNYYKKLANYIIEKSGCQKGYCLILDAQDCRLACSLVQQSDLSIIIVEKDAKKAAKQQSLLRKAGVYGSRISVHHIESQSLPYRKYFANLILSQTGLTAEKSSFTAEQVANIARPAGGKIMLLSKAENKNEEYIKQWGQNLNGWQVEKDDDMIVGLYNRDELEGIGQWTHLYADTSNTDSSTESNIDNKMTVQWFGKPGPRKMIDRHHRTMIITADAYNGTNLWEVEVPGSRRLGMMNDCGNMCVADDVIYIANNDKCWALNVADGNREKVFDVPQIISGQKSYWGYIATDENLLFGSGQKPTASFTTFGFGNSTVGQIEGDFREKTLSDFLFATDRTSGKTLWNYKSGVIQNSTIVADKNCIYFIECRNPEITNDADGRISSHKFCEKDTFIICLDRTTGKKNWEKEFKLPYQHQIFMVRAKDILLMTGSYNIEKNVHYGLYGLDITNGNMKWHNSFKGEDIGGTHGEQWQRPSVIAGKVYLMPYAFNLDNGKQIPDWSFTRQGHGCGTITGSEAQLFFRGHQPQMRDLKTDTQTKLTQVSRPGCWVNIIPAGGLILIPESSSGCTCAYSLQTSIAFTKP